MSQTFHDHFVKLEVLIVGILLFFMFFTGCSDDAAGGAGTYSVIYIGNGGSPVPTDSTAYTNGQTVTVNDGSGISFSGHLFAGWTNAAGDYVSGSIVMGSADLILYASWDSAYSVTYIGNGGTPVPTDTGVYTNGQSVNVDNGSGITLTGYVFSGWTNAAGSTISGSLIMGNTNVILYAGWTKLYTLSYIGNGGSPVPSAVIFTNGQQITIDDGISISWANGTFQGWTNATGSTVSGTVTGGSSDIILYADWQLNRFVDNGDGTITDNDNNLMWFKNGRPMGTSATFHEMTNFCGTSTYAGYSDWRLPEIQELQTLIDTGFTPININTGIFTNMSTSRYLSISKWYGLDNYRWYVAFYPTSNETLNTNATSTNSKWYFLPVRTIP